MRWWPVLVLAAGCRRDVEVHRVELSEASQLLTGRGDTATLRATAYDADGNALPDAEITWRTDDRSVVTVSPEGRLEAATDVGWTQVRAVADGVSSDPMLAWVARVPDGALLFDDRQLVEGPTQVGGPAPVTTGTRFEVVLDDVPVPAPGVVVLAAQDAPVAGKVVSASKVAKGVAIELEVAPLPELFIDVALELHDRGVVEVTPQPAGEFELAGFDCESAVTPTGGWPVPDFVLGVTDQITVDRDVVIDLQARELQRVLLELRGVLRLDVAGTVQFPLKLDTSLECRRRMGLLKFPFPGVFALLLATKVPLGVGFVADGAFEANGVSYTATGFARVEVDQGFEYTATDGMRTIDRFEPSHDLKVTWATPLIEEGATIKASLFPYLYADLNVGHPMSEFLGREDDDYEIVALKAGVKGEYELTAPVDQVHDPVNQSKYSVAAHGELGYGDDMAELLQFFGLPTDTLQLDPPKDSALLRSPEGTGSVDPPEVVKDQKVTVRAELDPATVDFTDGYNVEAVHVLREQNGAWNEVSTVPAEADGQTTFDWEWTPTQQDQDDGATQFAWLVETKEMPGVLLEIEPDSRESVGEEQATVTVYGPYLWYFASLPVADNSKAVVTANYQSLLLAPSTLPVTLISPMDYRGTWVGCTLRSDGPNRTVLEVQDTIATGGSGAQCDLFTSFSFSVPGTLTATMNPTAEATLPDSTRVAIQTYPQWFRVADWYTNNVPELTLTPLHVDAGSQDIWFQYIRSPLATTTAVGPLVTYTLTFTPDPPATP